MAVLKLLVSVAVLGTVVRSQQDIYNAYSPGQYASAGGTALARGTPRLIPVKVRGSASRLSPSYSSFPSFPFPHYRYSPHSPLSPLSAQSQSQQHQQSRQTRQPGYPRHHQQYRPAMTGYYRPNRPYYNAYESGHSGHQLGYRAAATTAYPAAGPAVLKRGRVLPAASPYGQQTLGSGAGQQYSHQQSFPQASHSQYRPAPQIQASPVHHVQPHLVQVQQPQQPAYYVQKAPVGRPLKTIKAVRRPPTTDPVETEEEEYPGDPNPQYNFSFDIKDDELTNYQNRQEERDGQTIKGSYSVVDPDGYVRTVTYTADPKNGFQAKVTREPTDVKIKFPVPTEAPQQTHQLQHKVAGPQGRGQQQQYIPQGQYQHQPQYQSAPQYQQAAAYATPQQTYAAQPSYVPRTRSRFAVQPQAATQPRLVTRYTQ